MQSTYKNKKHHDDGFFKVDDDQGNVFSNDNPDELFNEWFELASDKEINDPGAMCLSTIDADGFPDQRLVLLKEFKDGKFFFYSNMNSQKGMQIANHPKVSLCFHWKALRRQIRVKGEIFFTDNEDCDQYFASRPRGAQIGAWASQQSEVLENREILEQRVKEFEKKFKGEKVNRPPFWKGYFIQPNQIEFWVNKPSRLHERKRFYLSGNDWCAEHLYP